MGLWSLCSNVTQLNRNTKWYLKTNKRKTLNKILNNNKTNPIADIILMKNTKQKQIKLKCSLENRITMYSKRWDKLLTDTNIINERAGANDK